MTDLEELVLGELKLGHNNAIPGRILASRLLYKDDRPVRLAIEQLLKQGQPILSSIKPPYGYYLGETISEVVESQRVLLSRIKGGCRRYKYIRNNSRRISGQLRLGV